MPFGPQPLFPRNRRGGVLFRFYTGSVVTFVSFCCPSRFRPRPRGSLDLVEEKRSVVSDRRRASAGKSGSCSSARKWRRETHRTIAWYTLGTCGVALFRGCRHRSKRMFGRSRRDLAICVAGTPGCRLRPTMPRARPAFPLLKLNLPVRTGKKHHTCYRLEMHPACGTAAEEVTFPQPLGISGYRTLSI